MAIDKGVGTNPVDIPVITLSGLTMPMQKLTIHACTLGVTLISSQLVSANSAPWSGSYVAEGECFCTGSLGRDIDSRIIPTPVGGQSVAQVCDRIGAGPKLQKVNGKFNYTVYADAQCGHGPSLSDATSAHETCSGYHGVAGEDCVAPGPKWNLEKAFAKPDIAEAKPGIADTPRVTGGSRYILPPANTITTESESALSSNSESENPANTAVKKIVQVRSNSQPMVKPAPLTKEQIRARQLVQMEAARERANLRAGKSATDHLEVIKSEEEKSLLAKSETEIANQTIAAKTEDAVETSAQSIAKSAEADASTTAATLPTTVSALKLPVATRNSAREFDYVQGMPINYDFGGAGVELAASVSSHRRVQYLLKAAEAESYREALIGVGIFLSPRSADRLTILLSTGIEYGKFEFSGSGVDTDLNDTGAYIGFSSRYVLNNKFELQAGVGYSSFFEGDAVVSGSAFYHLTPNLDLTTKAEGGDNDSLGFGIRYYY